MNVRAWAIAGAMVLFVGMDALGQIPAEPAVVIPSVVPTVAEAPPALTPAPIVATPPAVPAPPAQTPSPMEVLAPGLVPPPAPAPADTKAVPLSFEAKWNNGLWFQTKNKEFVFHVGGVLQYDAGWYEASPNLQDFTGGTGPFNDGVAPRRARIRSEGSFYKNVDYIMEVEFANGVTTPGLSVPQSTNTVWYSPAFTDMFVTIKEVPFVGNVRIGNQKEPMSLEHINSARYLEFMERSFMFDASQVSGLNNARNPGVSVYRTWAQERVFSAVGIFKNVGSTLNSPFGYGIGDGKYAVTGRLTGMPIWKPEEQTYFHIGGAMSERDPVDGQVRLRVRDSVRAAPGPLLNIIADTGALNASSQTLYNIETAGVYGRWTMQAEYTASINRNVSIGKGPNLGTICFPGYYVEMLYFLTGESRPWDPGLARFNRVIPKRNFLTTDSGNWCVEGWGAWELAARYNYIDLTEGGVYGARLRGATVGLNWYLNPNMKMQFNYDYTYRDQASNPLAKGQINSFGTRLAIDF